MTINSPLAVRSSCKSRLEIAKTNGSCVTLSVSVAGILTGMPWDELTCVIVLASSKIENLDLLRAIAIAEWGVDWGRASCPPRLCKLNVDQLITWF